MNSLNAISPIDGRYRDKVEPLAAYFSEGALIRYRLRRCFSTLVGTTGQTKTKQHDRSCS